MPSNYSDFQEMEGDACYHEKWSVQSVVRYYACVRISLRNQEELNETKSPNWFHCNDNGCRIFDRFFA